VWDYRNRLKTVESYAAYGGSVTKQVDYAYDAGNQLVKRVVDPDGGTGSAAIDQTFYLYDQGQVTLEFHKTGSGSATASHLSHRYLWNPAAVDQLLTDEQVHDLYDSEENETLWALTDRLGSVTDMVDYLGTHRLHRAFDSFGNVTNETHYDADGIEVTAGWPGYVDMAFAYTGRFYDKTTGLQNNLNRWYDASTGRWLSEDPISFAAGDVNLYRYVGNGPVNWTDPSGLEARPGKKPPKHWPEPKPKWKWDAGEGKYKKGGKYYDWDTTPGHKPHWNETDKNGNKHRNIYEFRACDCLDPLPSYDPTLGPYPNPLPTWERPLPKPALPFPPTPRAPWWIVRPA
jgi:RHS repeat-associated protein